MPALTHVQRAAWHSTWSAGGHSPALLSLCGGGQWCLPQYHHDKTDLLAKTRVTCCTQTSIHESVSAVKETRPHPFSHLSGVIPGWCVQKPGCSSLPQHQQASGLCASAVPAQHGHHSNTTDRVPSVMCPTACFTAKKLSSSAMQVRLFL